MSYQQALTLFQAGKDGEALEHAQRHLATQTCADTLQLIALIHYRRQQYEAACPLLQQAIAINASEPFYHANLGNCYHQLKQYPAAIACFKRSLELEPNLPDTHYNLGNAQLSAGNLIEATHSFRRTLQLAPKHIVCWNNLGIAELEQGHLQAAEAAYQTARTLSPNDPNVIYNIARLRLLQQAFKEGWTLYLQRWESAELKPKWRDFKVPRWSGESGANLLLWGEQGAGDKVMFLSLLAPVLERCDKVYFLCDPRWFALLQRSFPQLHPIVSPTNVAVNFHCPVGDLGYLFGQGGLHPTPPQPFLKVDPRLVQTLKRRYNANSKRLLVGIAWMGGHGRQCFARSIALQRWLPLLVQSHCQFVCLQHGVIPKEVKKLQPHLPNPIIIDQAIDPYGNLSLFASQVACCDIILTIDNSLAHIAGALGVPTWVAIPNAPDWRWGLAGNHCYWYPSLSLFRQTTTDWDPVLKQWAHALQQLSHHGLTTER